MRRLLTKVGYILSVGVELREEAQRKSKMPKFGIGSWRKEKGERDSGV